MNIDLKNIEDKTAILYLTAILVLPRSYILIKLFFLFLFIGMSFVQFYRKKKLYIDKKIFTFYGLIIAIGITWSVIGYINGGSVAGISDNFRLWVIWSICYAIVVTLFIQRNSILFFHKAVVMSGILIAIINIVGLCSNFYGLNLIPESVLKELDLKFGFHEGYVQITTENITSLFFIVPYLLAIQFRKDAAWLNNKATKFTLFLCFFVAVFSGRRALWLSILMTPFIVLGISLFVDSTVKIRNGFRRFTYLLFFAGIAGTIFIATSDSLDMPTLTHLKEAFSAEDERSIQKVFLLDAFWNYPFFGSGFGGSASYSRSETRSWLYELTYHQLLFNFGLLGIFCIVFVLGCFFYMIIRNLNRNKLNDLIPFCILVGITSFAIGSYSNPYFQSFDFLIYIGMIPYLASINLSNDNSNN